MKPLRGKSVVVTGAGQGIGAAYALGAAELGASVVVNDIDGALAERTAARIVQAGGRAVAQVADISMMAQAASLMERCMEQFGTLDGLINNAALYQPGRLDELDERALRSMLEVNVMGTAFCASYALAHMRKAGKGSIVNVTSGAQAGIPAMGIYGATKGAVASFTYAWAAELAGTGVRVNAISPIGLTRMSEANDRYRAERGLPVYLRTPAPVEANVPVACFLLSDESSDVNGQIVRIEGRLLSLMTHPAVLVPALECGAWTFEAVSEAFRTDLAKRQLPTGVVGLKAEVDLSVARARRKNRLV